MEEAPGKRKRASDAGTGCLAGDRLSALPDVLLHGVMSHMKARQVVQTCVLSKRWRHLWRSVPCLNVDQDEFKTAGAEYPDYKGWEKFEDFMDTLLCPHNVSIAHLDTFRLHASNNFGWGADRHASRWIRRGIAQPCIQRERLSPSSWRIKRLHLSDLWLDDWFAKHVRSGCQFLEDLELNSCLCDFRAITSHSLKNLVMKYGSWKELSEITSPTLKNLIIDRGSYTKDCLLVITAPALAYMFLGVTAYNFVGGLSFSEMPSLAKASIHLCDNRKVDRFKILGSVSNVMTSLELSRFETMVLAEESMAFPEFKILKTLSLDNCDLSDGFRTLGNFLRNSPNLEKLTLRRCKYLDDSKKKKGTSKSKSTPSASCHNLVDTQCENLKLTEIIYQDDDVRQLIELLLRISRNLPNNRIKLTKVD